MKKISRLNKQSSTNHRADPRRSSLSTKAGSTPTHVSSSSTKSRKRPFNMFFHQKKLTLLVLTCLNGDILGATELRGPVNFHYKDLKIATKNFSQENKLGGGVFGDVYKGVLRNGKIVAVKKLALSQSTIAKEDFESEAKLISNVHHRNVIRLLGCCSRGTELLLIYQFMANSNLDKLLFGERRGTLSWKQRVDIIIGMARGIVYLHDEFHSCIIHRDIKSSNILLDDDLQPKIADFGLARLLPEDKSHLSTRFAGTLLGCMGSPWIKTHIL